MKKIISIFSLLLIIVSCKNEVKPLVFETEVISQSFDANIEIAFNRVKGKSIIANSINTTIEKELIKTIPNSETYKSLNEALDAFNEQYKTFSKEFEEESQPWELNIETEIVYESQEVITLVLSSYSDTGGAHGNDRIQLLNFNTNTGTLYSKSEIINDIPKFKILAESYFLKNLESEGLNISEFFFGKPFQLPENFGFSEEGLILVYNVYEIASYSQGYTEFVIPFEEAANYLKIN